MDTAVLVARLVLAPIFAVAAVRSRTGVVRSNLRGRGPMEAGLPTASVRMSRLVTLASFVLVVGLCGCHRDTPTAPDGTAPPRGTLAPELAGFAPALEDLRDRIVPTLGNGPVFDALGNALEEVEGALSTPDTAALEGALARANAAATQLTADSILLPDLDVVRLLLADITAATRASIESAPREAANPPREP